MNSFEEQKNRQIVPRWLLFSSACALIPEEALPHRWLRSAVSDSEFELKRAAWSERSSDPYAIDFVASALIRGDHLDADVQRSARWLLRRSVSPIAKQLARTLLDAHSPRLEVENFKKEQIIKRIRVLKNITTEEIRNPLAHIDLAYFYTLLSQHDKAEIHVQIALITAKCNTHVLAAAARFYLHRDKHPEKSLWLLRRNPGTPMNPTLLSAEVAISEAYEIRSPFRRTAQRAVTEFDVHPWFRSELAGTVATLEVKSGSLKNAKKTLRAALECPTENALAQVRWLIEHTSLEVNVPSDCHPLAAFEADMIRFMQEQEYREALDAALGWTEFEPYAERPAVCASYIASFALEDFSASERIIRAALLANPDSFLLNNNLAVTLAITGRCDEAAIALTRTHINCLTPEQQGVYIATRGLIQFRNGDTEAGRADYRNAVEEFRHLGERHREAVALMFWAQEEMRIMSGDFVGIATDALRQVARVSMLTTPLEKRLRNAIGV